MEQKELIKDMAEIQFESTFDVKLEEFFIDFVILNPNHHFLPNDLAKDSHVIAGKMISTLDVVLSIECKGKPFKYAYFSPNGTYRNN